MKKAQKNVLGMLSLVLVAIVTAFAAYLPSPEAAAASSVTDTVIIRVLAGTANVDVSGITSGSTLIEPNQNINISHENVETLIVTIKYTDKDGVETSYTMVHDAVDIGASNKSIDLNLRTGEYTYGGYIYNFPNHGYGKYVITVYGEGPSGTDEQNIGFTFIPVIAEVAQDDNTGKVNADLTYIPDDGTPSSPGDVATLTLNVYDKDGNLITPMSPITVTAPTDQVELPFEQYDLPSGEYILEVIAHNKDGDDLYLPYYVHFTYKASEKDIVVPSTGTPDTGGLFGNLGASKTDVLITGLLVFFAIGIGSVIFIARRNKKPTRR